MKFTYSISKNHYSGYTTKESNKISTLLQDLATRCMSPVAVYGDKEQVDVSSGKEWVSKNHRSNATIVKRGNLGMIDFEGKSDKLKELLNCIESKNLWFAAIPSQSNLSDLKNDRFHIVYLLSEPYSINSEAYKTQAKEFFEFVGYKWDDPDSGIDTRATFNACGYFSPTIPLNDAKSEGNKKISKPYKILEDIEKDTRISSKNEAYNITAAESTTPNELINSVIKRGRRVKGADFKILRTTSKGYVLSADSYIETTKGKYMTFEALADSLADVEGDNPRISMLGCPICNEGHTAPSTIGYAYMQYDNNDNPYICCTGNACETRPYFTMADGNISVFRVDNADGSHKYVMFEDNQIIYTHSRDKTYKLSASAVADELYNKGQYSVDDYNEYSQNNTINTYVTGVESIQINHNPFAKEGLNIYDRTFTVSPAARFEPIEDDADEVISEAIKAFDDDVKLLGYPISLIYIAYYIFHYEQIMAVLALVNSDRGSGKSFWVLDLPTWYLSHAKVSAIGSSAVLAGWDDEKHGKRLVVYEDIENLKKNELGKLKSDIKSDATSGNTKMLNVKGKGKSLSFGFNSAITSNSYNQIPFDGSGDRRIYPSPYKMLDNSTWLASKLKEGRPSMIKHRTNAINFLYKIYKHCESSKSRELWEALYYKVPQSTIRGVVEDSTSTDGHTALNIIKRAKTKREIVKNLIDITVTSVDSKDIENLIEDIELNESYVRISGVTLRELWKMLPTGKDSMKSLNYRNLLSIFGVDSSIKTIRINGVVIKGIEVKR